MDAAKFAEALAGLENPLRFVTRNNGAMLDRVRDLHATLHTALTRSLELCESSEGSASLRRVRELIPDDGDTRSARLDALCSCLALVKHVSALPLSSRVGSTDSAAMVPSKRKPPASKARIEDRATWNANDSVRSIRGVGPRLAGLLAGRHVESIRDLLLMLPRRYEDRRIGVKIAQLEPGDAAVVEGEVVVRSSQRARGRQRLEVVVDDGSGRLRLVWFRLPHPGFGDRFGRGVRLRAAGTLSDFRGHKQMVHPEVSDSGLECEHPAGGVLPVYSELEGLKPTTWRKIMSQALSTVASIDDPLPLSLRRKNDLSSLAEALVALHAPPTDASASRLNAFDTTWQRRLIYGELLMVQLAVLRRRQRVREEPGLALRFDTSAERLAATLFPFPLTAAQSRVLADIEDDLSRDRPMQRLVQGDVGSGKTAVALTAMVAAARCGVQAALIAPTEILAEQHARQALKVLPQAGVRLGVLTGSLGASEKRRVLARLAEGAIDVVVGTHAVIQERVRFRRLALGIVDEQHRFGVMQRARLVEQGQEGWGASPHMLVMTATPIPRTLALTVYGDLDVSVIDELPPGRIPVRTFLRRGAERGDVYRVLRQVIDSGQQGYVVFPLVEESDKEGMDRLRDATSAADELAEGPLRGARIGLLHGRMSGDEKDRIMRAFGAHQLDVLVSTTVIEVGVDVPRATVMVIENAERFGLSQLHQLRGRVGRGAEASQCFLLSSPGSSEEALRRLEVMVQHHDGFRIAEKDLSIRGPGDFLGTRQSGLPFLSFADLSRDREVLERARRDAEDLLNDDPALASAEHAGLREELASTWNERVEWLRGG